jgi:carboxyl-terminal processing protease
MVFSGADRVAVILPSQAHDEGSATAIEHLGRLLNRERFEFEVELGAPMHFSSTPLPQSPAFLVGPASMNLVFQQLEIEHSPVPVARKLEDCEVLVVDGPDIGAVTEGLSLLRTLTTTGSTQVTATDCNDLHEAVARIEHEIATTYPAFALRNIDWPSLCEQHRSRVLSSDAPVAAVQAWIATLQDMHTSVRSLPAQGLLPYALHVSPDHATFWRVPEWSRASIAGVRPGDQLLDVDCVDALERNGAPPHMHPWLAGRRLLSGPVDTERTFRVRKMSGEIVRFSESPTFTPWQSPVEWRQLSSNTGYLKLNGFPPGVNDEVDFAFHELKDCDRLIVDLRGNSGGLLVEALDFRDRFVPQTMQTGYIQFSSPFGGLSPKEPIIAEPATRFLRWTGPVRFLVDPLTASASEDALLGLNHLEHIKLIGTCSAGGSGRPRSIRLIPDLRLSVSTALTWELNGNCIEGSGLIPDIEMEVDRVFDDQNVIALAERSF